MQRALRLSKTIFKYILAAVMKYTLQRPVQKSKNKKKLKKKTKNNRLKDKEIINSQRSTIATRLAVKA